ncbi:MAG: hypothetical protein ABI683_02510 [Ginsengibacter sp.]
MKMDETSVNKKVDDALGSIDNISRASATPFFFTRLEARMLNGKNVWNRMSSFFARPVIAFTCICIVIMINLAVLFSSIHSENLYTQAGNEVAAVDEYNQVATGLYELEK